jgi:hypothetical protein
MVVVSWCEKFAPLGSARGVLLGNFRKLAVWLPVFPLWWLFFSGQSIAHPKNCG